MSAKNSSFRQVTLKIPESKYPFFMELAKSLEFVKEIEEEEEKPPTKEQVLESIVEGIREVRRHQKGEIKLTSAKEFLDEL